MINPHFQNLSPKEQKNFIINLMKLFTELDQSTLNSSQSQNIKSSKTSYENLKKFLFSNFLIQSSYAQNNSDEWNELAKLFIQDTENKNYKNKCFFAGWPSQILSESPLLCSHPSKKPNESSILTKYHSVVSGCTGSQVKCNPLIFGYKKIEDRSVFCVETKGFAKNSSQLCMQKALTNDSDDSTDSKEKRLEYLKDKYSDSQLFQKIQEFTLKSCLCDAETFISLGFNEKYLNYHKIKTHRTCHGLVQMISTVGKNVCTTPNTSTIKKEFFEDFTKWTSKQNYTIDIDSPYTTWVQKNQQFIQENVCSPDPDPEHEPEPELEPQLTLQAECTENNKVKVTATQENADHWTFSWDDDSDSQTEKTVDPGSKEVCGTLKKENQNDIKSCATIPDTCPENEDPALPPSIEVKLKNIEAEQCFFTAETSNDEGWSFYWNDDEAEEKEITFQQENTELEVCGYLKKDGEKHKSCAKCPPKITAPLPPAPPQLSPPRPLNLFNQGTY